MYIRIYIYNYIDTYVYGVYVKQSFSTHIFLYIHTDIHMYIINLQCVNMNRWTTNFPMVFGMPLHLCELVLSFPLQTQCLLVIFCFMEPSEPSSVGSKYINRLNWNHPCLFLNQWFNGNSRGNPGLYHHIMIYIYIYIYMYIHTHIELSTECWLNSPLDWACLLVWLGDSPGALSCRYGWGAVGMWKFQDP